MFMVMNMKTEKFYNQTDLQVYYYHNDKPIDIKTINYIDKLFVQSGFYKMIFWLSCDRIFEMKGKRINITDGALVLIPPKQSATFERTSNKLNNYLKINVSPLVFNDIIGDSDFLRAFDGKSIENMLFYPEKFKSETCYNLLKSLVEALDKHLGRVHIISKIFSIISELDVTVDEQNINVFKGSENLEVKVIAYIEKHFTEKISLDDICEKYFISTTTLNSILKHNKNMTAHQYINYLRATEANKLLKTTSYSKKNIASVCGFSDYSAFYRNFKKFIGEFPNRPNY